MFAGQVIVFGLAILAQLFYFVGARLSGVTITRVQIIVFTVSGLLAGLAALLHTARAEQGSHIDSNGYELNAIAAVVIGGTSLSGGVGPVVGSMIGALILSILDNILGLRNIQSEYQAIRKGIIIVLAVILHRKPAGGAQAIDHAVKIRAQKQTPPKNVVMPTDQVTKENAAQMLAKYGGK